MSRLRRYELHATAEQPWETLSGGQQARLQILLLEIGGANLLLLDEPTDNLDVASAEALEVGLEAFQGTVICVTHDRWFLRGFDRFVAFGADGEVREIVDPAAAYSPIEHSSHVVVLSPSLSARPGAQSKQADVVLDSAGGAGESD